MTSFSVILWSCTITIQHAKPLLRPSSSPQIKQNGTSVEQLPCLECRSSGKTAILPLWEQIDEHCTYRSPSLLTSLTRWQPDCRLQAPWAMIVGAFSSPANPELMWLSLKSTRVYWDTIKDDVLMLAQGLPTPMHSKKVKSLSMLLLSLAVLTISSYCSHSPSHSQTAELH